MSAGVGAVLTHEQIERIRSSRGRSILLFITDRCPVGCEHCSVDSRATSPMITDFERFERIVDWIAGQFALEVVGISGGEPFVERRGLTLATSRFVAAGKRLVVFTSGVWAVGQVPRWIHDVLNRLDCVYLSTDAFHARAIADDCFVRASQTIVESGAWLVVQVVDQGGVASERAAGLLSRALGEQWGEVAEINVIAPLLNGRGASVFERLTRAEGHTFGPCSLVRSPMVRYDGTVTGCCNESVIMGQGPDRLVRRAEPAATTGDAVARFHSDPLLRVIGDVGLGVLTEHPRFSDLAHRRYSSNCELCWSILERMPAGTDPLVDAIAALGAQS